MEFFDSKIKIARDTIEEVLNTGKPFSPEEVLETIKSRGGINRIALGLTLGQFYDKLEDRGFIRYNANLDKFEVLKTFY